MQAHIWNSIDFSKYRSLPSESKGSDVLDLPPDQWLAGLLEMQYWRISFGPSDQVSSSSRTQPLGKGAQVPSYLHVACSVPGLLYPYWGGWAERLADIFQPPSPFRLVVDHLTSSGHSLMDLKCETQWFNPLCPHILAMIDTSSIKKIFF